MNTNEIRETIIGLMSSTSRVIVDPQVGSHVGMNDPLMGNDSRISSPLTKPNPSDGEMEVIIDTLIPSFDRNAKALIKGVEVSEELYSYEVKILFVLYY